MLGLVVQNLRIIIALDLRLPEGATHEAFKLFDILKTVLEIVEIVDVLEQLFGVRVAAYLHLLHHVDVGVLVLAHRCSYINNIGRKIIVASLKGYLKGVGRKEEKGYDRKMDIKSC